MIIIRLNAYMRIIFKILDASLIFFDMTLNSVKIGRAVLLLHAMKKAVNVFKFAPIVTDGKSNNSIL